MSYISCFHNASSFCKLEPIIRTAGEDIDAYNYIFYSRKCPTMLIIHQRQPFKSVHTHVYVRHKVYRNVALSVAIAVCLLPVITANSQQPTAMAIRQHNLDCYGRQLHNLECHGRRLHNLDCYGNPTTQPRLLRQAVTQPFSIDVSS